MQRRNSTSDTCQVGRPGIKRWISDHDFVNMFIFPAKTRSIPVLSSVQQLSDIRFSESRDQAYLHLKAVSDPNRLLVYYHGNAEDLVTLQNHTTLLNVGKLLNANIICPEFPGYSFLQHLRADESSLEAMARDSMQYCLSFGLPIIVFGFSMGGAVAIHSMTCCPSPDMVECVVLKSTFTSISAAVSYYTGLPFLPYLMLERFASDEKIQLIDASVPIIFAHGAKDKIVPVEHSRRLSELRASVYDSKEEARRMTALFVAEDAKHNNLSSLSIMTVVQSFLNL